ncbi:MAG TPA: ATPase, T2SS/T4P/T4SS family [Anaerolineales bacterium]|nr:ATPase, T2SS/T4P/T4SS family [Anaerolineales bacterium]
MTTWASLAKPLTITERQSLVEETTSRLKGLSLEVLRDRQRLRETVVGEMTNAAARLGLGVGPEVLSGLVNQAVAQLGGLGFINPLLPPARTDLSEIALTPDGGLWVLPKGARNFVLLAQRPPHAEVWRTVEALLAPLGRNLSEATPSVDAKLPRMEGFGGARVKIIHPVLTPGAGYPSINIRLFEAKPVTVAQLVEWDVAPPSVLNALVQAVTYEHRLLVVGGTATGKTTILSALCEGIPRAARVVKIEDPEEIWLDHPHVVTLEARPALPGSEVPAYSTKNGVDDAMRMSPRWLIVGEVRTGDVALSLFRAQMSDHPGLSTFHASSPHHAIHRMALIMFTDKDVKIAAAKENFAQAVDLLVQVGWLGGKRRILGVWAVDKELRGGDVKLHDLYLADGYRMNDTEDRVGQLKQWFGAEQPHAALRTHFVHEEAQELAFALAQGGVNGCP